MILGSRCTRNCGFCAVDSSGPDPLDPREPEMIADAASVLGLRYVVVTSVTRDDLPDGGAEHFARTISAVKFRLPNAKVEVLVPDFRGDAGALRTVLDAKPDVFNHNIETVARNYPLVRPGAEYVRSLRLLQQAAGSSPGFPVKSGFMLGLGETYEEIVELLGDLRRSGCHILTIGQYLRPTKNNLAVVEYIRPEAFAELGRRALDMGFRFVASGPLVRSSMHAEEMFRAVKSNGDG